MYYCKSAESSGCEVTIEDNRVVPKCKTYHVQTFEKQFLGTTLVYLSSNQPVQCPHCDKWVTSYNLLAHALTHGVRRDNMERYEYTYNDYKVGIIDESKKEAILSKVKLKDARSAAVELPSTASAALLAAQPGLNAEEETTCDAEEEAKCDAMETDL